MLVLAQASLTVPPDLQSVEASVRESRACLDSAGTDYRGVTTLLFDEIGGGLREHCDPVLVPPWLHPEGTFRVARDATLADLAEAALGALVQSMGPLSTRDCSLAIYSSSGVDEAYLQSSTIGQLASRFGFSQVPHFGLFQLQGASLPGAIELIEAMLPLDQGGVGAFFVSAEKWPTPFPRVVGNRIVLGDAAAALWLCRSEDVPGLQVVGCTLRAYDPFVDLTVGHVEDDFCDLTQRAVQAVADCLRASGVAAAEVSGWICSGLGVGLDRKVREQLGITASLIVGENNQNGYLSAAAMPFGIAELLDSIRQDRARPEGIVAAFGASFGGSIGVLLLRISHGAPK